MLFTRFSGTLKNSAYSFFSFFILNHFHPDKLNETLENGPSAQQCSPTVKYVIVFVQVIVKSYLLAVGNNLLSLLFFGFSLADFNTANTSFYEWNIL